MASTTPKYALPYPALGDTPDVPYYLQQLASQAEAVMQTLAVQQSSDATYPKVASAVTVETVIDRISIASAAYLRTALVTGNAYGVAATAVIQADYVIYASINGGAFSSIGYGRHSLGVSLPEVLHATGKVDIPAGQTCVLEIRVSRFSGTGTLTTSISSGFTNTNCLLLRK
jgi:hypothetical protein